MKTDRFTKGLHAVTMLFILEEEAMITVGREFGASNAALSKRIGVDSSVASRRFDSAKNKLNASGDLRRLVKQIREMALKWR